MTNYSLYPDQIDGYSSLPLKRDLIDEILAEDVNRLRDAIVKIEQELGVQPSASFGTVADRLNNVSDASAAINAHITAATGAHAASAISVDNSGGTFSSDDVQGVIDELSYVLSPNLNNIGENNIGTANSGYSNFFNQIARKSVLNLSFLSEEIQQRTQPSRDIVTGIACVHIVEVSDDTPVGDGYLQYAGSVGNETIQWRSPGDAYYGAAVGLTSLSHGDTIIVDGYSVGKIKLARTDSDLKTTFPLVEHFTVYQPVFFDGYFLEANEDFVQSKYITRSAVDAESTPIPQMVLGGIVYPANRGTLVLQKKTRAEEDWYPVGVLNLGSVFDVNLAETGNPTYIPSLTGFDTITLYDRVPVRTDYGTMDPDTNDQDIYNPLATNSGALQIAKYNIPLSNAGVALSKGVLLSAADETIEETNKISGYRIIHYKASVTDFNGQPNAADVYSVYDSSFPSSANNTSNTVRFSNVYIDPHLVKPTIENFYFEPVSATSGSATKLSGVTYYGSVLDKFDLFLESDDNVFNQSFAKDNILSFTTDQLNFPTGDGYGNDVDLFEIMDKDTGYSKYDISHLPGFTSTASYLIDDGYNTARRPGLKTDVFSTEATVSSVIKRPCALSDAYVSSGRAGVVERILVNTLVPLSTTEQEFFTDELQRIVTIENFNSTVFTPFVSAASILGETALQVGGIFDDENNALGLIYPRDDYSDVTILPTQTNDDDLSAESGDKFFQRLFYISVSGDPKPISSGRIRITSTGLGALSYSDIVSSNANRPCKIELKIPGLPATGTGFLDLGKLFDIGKYEDGDGVAYGSLVSEPGDFTVGFTFGEKSTAAVTNYAFAVRVTYFGAIPASKLIILTGIFFLE